MDDVAATGSHGASALAERLGNIAGVASGSGGDLFANLQPLGPPLSFSPGEFLEPIRGETTEGKKGLEVVIEEKEETRK